MSREIRINNFKTMIEIGFLTANKTLKHMNEKIYKQKNHELDEMTKMFYYRLILKRNIMFHLYNMDVDKCQKTLNELNKVSSEILEYYNENNDIKILEEDLSMDVKDDSILEKDNGYLSLCNDMKKEYESYKNLLRRLENILDK